MMIEVDFDVFKELTNRRKNESDTYNDVIRRALKLAPEIAHQKIGFAPRGATFKGAFFPDGTQFRGTYKGRTYTAEIKGGAWIDSDGTMRRSPSEAVVKITKKNWNGWLFWHCKRPGDTGWQLIDGLRPSSEAKLAAL
jgi:hypothetical protein